MAVRAGARACCSGWPQPRTRPSRTPRAAQRKQIKAERAAAEARYKQAEADCSQRFAVSGCIAEAQAQRREALTGLRMRELALDEAKRKADAEESARRIEAKRAEAASKPPPVPRAASAPPAAAGFGRRRPCAAASARASAPRPPTMPPTAAARVAAQQRRASEAAAHRQEVEQRNAERSARGKKSAPLPVPSAASVAATAQRAGALGCSAGSGQRVDAQDGQRQVVAAAARTLARLVDQHLAGFARRQRVQDRAQFLGREVVPQAVAAGQQRVAELEPLDLRQRDRRVLVRAQAAGEQVALRVRQRLVLGELAFVDRGAARRSGRWCASPFRGRGSGRRANRRHGRWRIPASGPPGRPPACCAALPRR